MMLNIAQFLINATAASTAAIILVALLRKPMRMAVGAQTAYWLWSLVPVSIAATLLPAPPKAPLFVATIFTSYVSSILNSAATPLAPSTSSAWYLTAALIIWVVGAGIATVQLLRRQSSFLRSLGDMPSDSDGVRRSHSIVAPMLVGAWRPQVVVPADFEVRYTDKERELMLAHERAHLQRGDILANALAASWMCFSWFNPFTYLAMGWLRQDQELACDAKVLEQTGTPPRCYADALLKTQLATQSAWRMPVGCHWHSIHPLTKRIAMLKQPVPGFLRRLSGVTVCLALTSAGGYTVCAFSEPQRDSPPILIHLKLTVTEAASTSSQETQYLANSGESVAYRIGVPYDARCVAFSPSQQAGSLIWNKHLTGSEPGPMKGQILLECVVSKNGRIVAHPALITADAKLATVVTTDSGSSDVYSLEVTATTSDEKIEAARKAAAKY